jgi:hypothetical protein
MMESWKYSMYDRYSIPVAWGWSELLTVISTVILSEIQTDSTYSQSTHATVYSYDVMMMNIK